MSSKDVRGLNLFLRKQRTRKVGKDHVLIDPRDAIEKNSANFIPWRATFMWYGSEFDITATKAVFYVRAKDPGLAGHWTKKAWDYWMRRGKGPWIEDRFPLMSDQVTVERITDADFAIEYERAKRFDSTTLYMGDHPNPRLFWPRTLCKTAFQI